FRQDRRSRAHAERAARGATESDQHRHRRVRDRPADLRRARGCGTALSHDGLRAAVRALPQGGTSFRIIEKIFNYLINPELMVLDILAVPARELHVSELPPL